MTFLNAGRAAWSALCAATLSLATPAEATRDIVIDVATQTNTLTACGAFTGCLYTSAGGAGGAYISPTGFIDIADFNGGYARFSIGAGATSYQVLSGYSFQGGLGRVDFIDFYAPGRDTSVNGANRPPPDFQIQLRQVNVRSGFTDLEIAFAYNNPLTPGVNRIDAGATIGYSGATLGTQPGAPLGFPGLTFAGLPAQRLVSNDGGLLLGQRTTDSDFAFVVGNFPDPTFRTVLGLVSTTFTPRYVAGVPEPATWAMMVLGFSAVGGALRRRRGSGVAATA